MNMIEHSMPTIGKDEEAAVAAVIKTKFLAEGEVVRRFEEELSKCVGSKGGVATSTGTLALHLALLSIDVKNNDEVILPSYTCRAVLNAILYSGARPVLCNVNKEDCNISFAEAVKKMTRKTKAIIVPHMFGCPAEIDKFRKLGVYIIEDCAHAIGAEFKGRKVGSWGDLSIFSFEGTKFITTGEGGAVLANSHSLLGKLRKLKEPNLSDFKIKYTYRMTNLQAAIGRAQLSKIDSFINKRRKIACTYSKNFKHLNIEIPKDPLCGLHVFHRYMIKIKGDIKGFMAGCYKRGIKVKQPVKPLSIHRYLGLSDRYFPNTAYIMKQAISIPIYPSLNDKEITSIIAIVSENL